MAESVPRLLNMIKSRSSTQVIWIPLALLGLVILSYGLYIPWWGLYGDDWIYLWNFHLLGANSFADFVAVDRPFSAWVYTLATPLLGETALPYHVTMLVLRWLSAVLLWWILRMIWKDHDRQIAWMAAIFAVYPGFLQQPIAVQFILHFTVLDLCLLSIGLMVQAARKPERALIYSIIAVAASTAVFSIEYFVGLEMLRPVVFWLALREQEPNGRKRVLKTLKAWLPYLAVLAGFFIWRIFIFKFPTYQPNLIRDMAASPTETLVMLIKRVAGDLKTTLFDAWRQTFGMFQSSEWRGWGPGLMVVVFLLVMTISLRLPYDNAENVTDRTTWFVWQWDGLFLAVLALLFAGIPIWATLIEVNLSFPWDRATLPFMLGVCLTLVALMDMVVRPQVQPWVMAALLALAVGWQFNNALIYRDEWQTLREYFWQLTWRAPGLKPGTVVISDNIPLFRYSDNDLTAPLNWTYAPELRSKNTPYKYFDLSTRAESPLPGLEEGLRISHGIRSINFTSTTSSILSVYYDPPGCLWVIEPGVELAEIPETMQESQHLSKPELIEYPVENYAEPPTNLGAEPEHGWCYYFEKADLYKQYNEWQMIVDLGDEVDEKNLQPGNPFEYLPFITGYAHTGDLDKAQMLSEIVMDDGRYGAELCRVWTKIKEDVLISRNSLSTIDRIRVDLGCEK
jgi:hypothetical protein